VLNHLAAQQHIRHDHHGAYTSVDHDFQTPPNRVHLFLLPFYFKLSLVIKFSRSQDDGKQDTFNRTTNTARKEKIQYSLRISVMVLLIHISVCAAFTTSVTSPRRSLITSSSSSLAHSQPKQNNNEAKTAATFELSELTVKLNLRSMEAQKLTTANQIEPSKRVEIEGYIHIVNRRASSVPPWDLGQQLPGTHYRLSFSTQDITNQSLPAGASILLKFLANDQRRLDYCLVFPS
jgi:hypothetical protein